MIGDVAPLATEGLPAGEATPSDAAVEDAGTGVEEGADAGAGAGAGDVGCIGVPLIWNVDDPTGVVAVVAGVADGAGSPAEVAGCAESVFMYR